VNSPIISYFETLYSVLSEIQCSDGKGNTLSIDESINWTVRTARATHDDGKKIMFIGNGGSAGIASHMAIDFSKNGGMRALAFNDSAALTCLANDLGYENVFAKQMALHAHAKDLLIAISSSGQSANILNAVDVASEQGCRIMTLSGFSDDNPLRRKGEVNFYVPSKEYGFVEISHLSLCHGVLDIAMGWNNAR
jgi:D-sedoheptulose 7-phosphate isomerase